VKQAIQAFQEFVGRPVFLGARPILALLALPMALAFTQPLWHIHMEAPQYPKGLDLYIHAYKVEGGNDGHDVKEINVLNHYIGMRSIDRAELADLDWIPFAFGALVILALRVAAVGDVRSLIDLVVITSYVGAFSLARFVHKLWVFGHDLDPRAPVNIDPFMPVVIGKKQVANFTTWSYPAAGTYLVALFALGTIAVLAWHLVAGRRAAVREQASSTS
jgi:hypothetical protein